MDKEKLINLVIDQIREDVKMGDFQALYELLNNVYKYDDFFSFLTEQTQQKL